MKTKICLTDSKRKVRRAVGSFGAILAAFFLSASAVWAQDEAAQAPEPTPPPAAEASAPSPEPTPAPAAETPEPAPEPDFLTLERAAREKSPELFEKLKVVREFTKRLPNFWRDVKPTRKQSAAIYVIQKDYFDEISKLEARIERLEAERDAKMRAVLTEKQRGILDAKVAEIEKKRAEKAAAKEAAEELEAEREAAE